MIIPPRLITRLSSYCHQFFATFQSGCHMLKTLWLLPVVLRIKSPHEWLLNFWSSIPAGILGLDTSRSSLTEFQPHWLLSVPECHMFDPLSEFLALSSPIFLEPDILTLLSHHQAPFRVPWATCLVMPSAAPWAALSVTGIKQIV